MEHPKQMRILHIGMVFNPLRGGGNLRNSKIVEAINDKHNTEIHIITPVTKGFEDRIHEIEKLKKSSNKLTLHFSNGSIKQVLQAFRLRNKIKADVIHFHNIRVAFFSSFLFSSSSKVLEIHSFHELSWSKKILFRLIAPTLHHIIVLGPPAKELLSTKFGIDRKKISVIGNGFESKVGINPIKASPLSSEFFWISYIGTFHEWQGVNNFLKSSLLFIEKYPESRVKFIMIGDGPMYKSIRDNISLYDEEIKSKIILTGMVPPEEIEAYWQSVDVVTMPRPSTQATETTEPLKLYDAINHKKLILASNVGGFKNILKDRFNCLLHTPDNNAELACNFFEIYTDQNLRHKLLENIADTKRGIPTWETIGDKITDLYRDMTLNRDHSRQL